MVKHKSPWILQLSKRRSIHVLKKQDFCDTIIIGAGIAGITQAYYILKDTNDSVIVLEKDHAAHGASGHNAGQIASYFEYPFSEMVKKYGLKKAARAQRDVLSAWDQLDRIILDAKIKTKPESFAGFIIGLSKLFGLDKN